MSKISLILADDHAVVRSGLRMLLEAQAEIEIIAEAESGREAVSLARSLRPDIILMDIQMPDLNGIEATKQIKKLAPETAVLALTMHEDEQYFFEMLRAGASGYVPKRAAPDELLTAIRTVARGEVFLYPSLATRLVKDFLDRAGAEEQPQHHSSDYGYRHGDPELQPLPSRPCQRWPQHLVGHNPGDIAADEHEGGLTQGDLSAIPGDDIDAMDSDDNDGKVDQDP